MAPQPPALYCTQCRVQYALHTAAVTVLSMLYATIKSSPHGFGWSAALHYGI